MPRRQVFTLFLILAGCRARIRTWAKGSKVLCATATQPGTTLRSGLLYLFVVVASTPCLALSIRLTSGLLSSVALGGRLPVLTCDRYDELTPNCFANCLNDVLFFTLLQLLFGQR